MCDKDQQVRIDKWLWAARFFKTRSLAAKAVTGGKVFVNGQRVKAAKIVCIDDILLIRKGHQQFTVTVLDLLEKRGPAALARSLYQETEESVKKREDERAQRSLFYAGQEMPAKKPSKRDRRKIREFIRK